MATAGGPGLVHGTARWAPFVGEAFLHQAFWRIDLERVTAESLLTAPPGVSGSYDGCICITARAPDNQIVHGLLRRHGGLGSGWTCDRGDGREEAPQSLDAQIERLTKLPPFFEPKDRPPSHNEAPRTLPAPLPTVPGPQGAYALSLAELNKIPPGSTPPASAKPTVGVYGSILAPASPAGPNIRVSGPASGQKAVGVYGSYLAPSGPPSPGPDASTPATSLRSSQTIPVATTPPAASPKNDGGGAFGAFLSTARPADAEKNGRRLSAPASPKPRIGSIPSPPASSGLSASGEIVAQAAGDASSGTPTPDGSASPSLRASGGIGAGIRLSASGEEMKAMLGVGTLGGNIAQAAEAEAKKKKKK